MEMENYWKLCDDVNTSAATECTSHRNTSKGTLEATLRNIETTGKHRGFERV